MIYLLKTIDFTPAVKFTMRVKEANTMKKKILALILCVVMIIGILPVYAFAENSSATVDYFAQVLYSYICFND